MQNEVYVSMKFFFKPPFIVVVHFDASDIAGQNPLLFVFLKAFLYSEVTGLNVYWLIGKHSGFKFFFLFVVFDSVVACIVKMTNLLSYFLQ